jgi:hypothetical protein
MIEDQLRMLEGQLGEMTQAQAAFREISAYIDTCGPCLFRGLPKNIRSMPALAHYDMELIGDAILYIPEGLSGILMFSHPFSHHFFYMMPAMGNPGSEIEFKLSLAKQYATRGQWENFVFLFERPFRTQALCVLLHAILEHRATKTEAPSFDLFYAFDEIVSDQCLHTIFFHRDIRDLFLGFDELGDPDKIPIYQIARSVWMDCENIPQTLSLWKMVFLLSRHERLYETTSQSNVQPPLLGEGWMTAEDLAAYAELPQTLTVYRGECNDGGISWTTDRKVAKFFAHRNINESTGRVLKRKIQKNAIFAYFTSRSESEVLLIEPLVEDDSI